MFGATGFSAVRLEQALLQGRFLSGVAATGGVGSVSINGDADAAVTGLQATASNGVLI